METQAKDVTQETTDPKTEDSRMETPILPHQPPSKSAPTTSPKTKSGKEKPDLKKAAETARKESERMDMLEKQARQREAVDEISKICQRLNCVIGCQITVTEDGRLQGTPLIVPMTLPS